MSTSVEAKRRRTVGLESFAHITDVPVAVDGIQPEGVLFDGDLTDEQIGDVWALLTSADDADLAARGRLMDLLCAVESSPPETTWPDVVAALLRDYLGVSDA